MLKIGLQGYDQIKLTPGQIETTRIAIRRLSRKKRRVWQYWVKLFPYCPITKKSVGMRMGKGKGGIKRWVCPVSRDKFYMRSIISLIKNIILGISKHLVDVGVSCLCMQKLCILILTVYYKCIL